MKKQNEVAAEKLKKANAETKRLADEAQAKLDKEEADRKTKLAADRKLKRAPDKEKLLAFATKLESIKLEFKMVDDESEKIFRNAVELVGKTVKYIRDNAEKI